jgi:aldose 1-epimerase
MDPLSPSGSQYEIFAGDQVVVVSEVGATLRVYQAGDWQVIDGFAENEIADGARGQVLCPWPNRLRDGNYVFESIACQAPLDEVERRNAIHGLVRWSPWQLAWRAQNRVRLEHVLFPQPAYRWCLGLALTYSLSADGLAVEVEAVNRGNGPLPFGVGFHPYVSLGAQTIDSACLSVPASTCLTTDDRAIPIGTASVEGTLLDFSSGAPLGGEVGPVRLDTCFTNLKRDDAGLATVTLSDASVGRSVQVWADRPFDCFMVYTGDTLPDVTARRRSVAIEPMTCWPNALQSGQGLIRLEAGQRWTSRWGIRPLR